MSSREHMPSRIILESKENILSSNVEEALRVASQIDESNEYAIRSAAAKLKEAAKLYEENNRRLSSSHSQHGCTSSAHNVRKARYNLIHGEVREALVICNNFLQNLHVDTISNVGSASEASFNLSHSGPPPQSTSGESDVAEANLDQSEQSPCVATEAPFVNLNSNMPISSIPMKPPQHNYQPKLATSKKVRFTSEAYSRDRYLTGVAGGNCANLVSSAGFSGYRVAATVASSTYRSRAYSESAVNSNNVSSKASYTPSVSHAYTPVSSTCLKIDAQTRYNLKSELLRGLGQPFSGDPQTLRYPVALSSQEAHRGSRAGRTGCIECFGGQYFG